MPLMMIIPVDHYSDIVIVVTVPGDAVPDGDVDLTGGITLLLVLRLTIYGIWCCYSFRMFWVMIVGPGEEFVVGSWLFQYVTPWPRTTVVTGDVTVDGIDCIHYVR